MDLHSSFSPTVIPGKKQSTHLSIRKLTLSRNRILGPLKYFKGINPGTLKIISWFCLLKNAAPKLTLMRILSPAKSSPNTESWENDSFIHFHSARSYCFVIFLPINLISNTHKIFKIQGTWSQRKIRGTFGFLPFSFYFIWLLLIYMQLYLYIDICTHALFENVNNTITLP